jgi:predicted transcriptional regulator
MKKSIIILIICLLFACSFTAVLLVINSSKPTISDKTSNLISWEQYKLNYNKYQEYNLWYRYLFGYYM